MNRAVISIAITLGVAILPLQVTAAERSALTYSAMFRIREPAQGITVFSFTLL